MISQELIDRLRGVLKAAKVDEKRAEAVLLSIQMTWAVMRYQPTGGDEEEELSALASLAAGVLEAERIMAGTPPSPWESGAVRLRLVQGGQT